MTERVPSDLRREYKEIWQEVHDDIASWPEHWKRNIIVGATDGNSYLLSDIKDLIDSGRMEPQPQLSGLIDLLPPKAA